MNNLDLLDSFSNVGAVLADFLDSIFEVIITVIDALTNLYNQLNLFLTDLVAMTDDASHGTMNGLPLYESIGMIRYLIGDATFKLMYVTIIVGCLFTIFKLGLMLYAAVSTYIGGLSNSGLGGTIKTKIPKWFRKF
jgi:hypothetical protein